MMQLRRFSMRTGTPMAATDLSPCRASAASSCPWCRSGGLVTQAPERLSLPVLAPLCDTLYAPPGEPIATRAEAVAPHRMAAGGDEVVNLAATIRP